MVAGFVFGRKSMKRQPHSCAGRHHNVWLVSSALAPKEKRKVAVHSRNKIRFSSTKYYDIILLFYTQEDIEHFGRMELYMLCAACFVSNKTSNQY
jgi:hypothetical protein